MRLLDLEMIRLRNEQSRTHQNTSATTVYVIPKYAWKTLAMNVTSEATSSVEAKRLSNELGRTVAKNSFSDARPFNASRLSDLIHELFHALRARRTC